jgi:hypothetical protein
MKRLRFPFLIVFLISYMLILSSCADKSGDIAILSAQDVFVQSAAINNKIDILWMMDSSGSMSEEQDNLAANFNVFINDFVTKGYEYNMAVSGTDAWRYEFSPGSTANLAKFRDGNVYTGTTTDNSGIFMINNLTANVIATFTKNIKVGITGSGDERAFDSIKQSLMYPGNAGYNFRRDDAYLAVIIISDEEDFSRNNGTVDGCTGSPMPAACQNLRPVSDYTTYLDTYTNSVPADRKYTVNAIGVFDAACEAANPSSSGHVGTRYLQLVNDTGGVAGSICDTDFSGTLNAMQNKISEDSTQFRLSKTPVVSSIIVKINSVDIPQNPTNGWTYDSNNNSIKFHGSALPPQGAAISITFDPTTLG